MNGEEEQVEVDKRRLCERERERELTFCNKGLLQNKKTHSFFLFQ